MSVKQTLGIIAFLICLPVLALVFWPGHSIAVLDPKGLIASEQYRLIVLSTLLMLVVVLPVFAMTLYISLKYRAGNTKATYSPDWDHNRTAETLWWGIPSVIILILAVITWKSSHTLDPFKPIASAKEPMTIQVIALPWKWLFIYPEEQIATVNYVRFPQNTPLHFQITGDAPMNSFWIPQLGGQIYAMPGMSTQLHLMADAAGVYEGSSANLSGRGFASMRFKAQSMPQSDFEQWIDATKAKGSILDSKEYARLAQPSEKEPPSQYSATAAGLYDSVIMKYMAPSLQKNYHAAHEMESQWMY